MTATSSLHTTRRGLSTAGALVLALAGNVLVIVISAVAVAAVVGAAAVVFGAGILESF